MSKGLLTFAQDIFPLGGYIVSECLNCSTKMPGEKPIYEFQTIVYFTYYSHIPDSIQYSWVGSELILGLGSASLIDTLCSGFKKVIYKGFQKSFGIGTSSVKASFRNDNVRLPGKNLDDSIEFFLVHRIIINELVVSKDNRSCTFIDEPIITHIRGSTNSINLFAKAGSAVAYGFEGDLLPGNLYLDPETGTIRIDNSLDTGYYNISIKVTEVGSKGEKFDISYLTTTLFIVDSGDYFISANALPPLIYVGEKDSSVWFQTNYFSSKEIIDLRFTYSSPIIFNIPPVIFVKKIGDSLINVKVEIHFDSTNKPKMSAPLPFNVIAQEMFQSEYCNQRLTSFVLVKNSNEGIIENNPSRIISVYPIPTNNVLYYKPEMGLKIDRLMICNSNGQLLLMGIESTLNDRTGMIDLTDFDTGIYFLIFYGEGIRFKPIKIIKQ